MDGMDRKIEKKFKLFSKRNIWIFAGSVVFLFVFYNLVFGDKSSKLNVDTEKISIAGINKDVFQDYIAVIGTVEPIKTIYLDAIEGGRVEEILIDEGNMLKKGDVIMRLSNVNLILDISNNEAQVARAINELRTARLLMVQQQMNSESQIIETERLLKLQERAYNNNKVLYKEEHISKEEFEQSMEQYEATVQKLDLLKEIQYQDSIFRSIQVESLETSVRSLTNNLEIIQQRLENLNIKAPVNGELASLNPEIGEVIMYGTRIGTVNILDSYKLRVEIDEHYIARVNRGLVGGCDFAGVPYPGKIIKLELGESKQAVLIPRGGFYQSTGGQWVFVIDESGEFAYRRDISIGRQNPRYYEVLSGLEPGEQVIISSYDTFGDVDKLILKN